MGFVACMAGTCCGCILVLLLMVFQIAITILAIYEAITLSKTTHLMNQCDNVWEWILAGCICIFVLVISGMYDHIFIPTKKELQEERNANPNSLDKFIHFFKHLACAGLVAVGIWALITLQHPSCEEYWQKMNPFFWKFVICHAALFFVGLGFIAIAMVAACTIICGALASVL